jgi:hypothetical protein
MSRIVGGGALVEGWAAASLRASVMTAQVLGYGDIAPGQVRVCRQPLSKFM